MTTTTTTYEIRFFAGEEAEGYPWEVYQGAELRDSFRSRREAEKGVREMMAVDRAEAEEEEANDLRGRLADRLEEMSLTELRKLSAQLCSH